MTERQRLLDMIANSEIIIAAEKQKAAWLDARRNAMLLAGIIGNAVLRAEQDAFRHRQLARVEQDRIKLAREKLREVTSDFSHEGETPRQTYDRLVADLKALESKRPFDRSAADDHEITKLTQRVHELGKVGRRMGWLEKEAA